MCCVALRRIKKGVEYSNYFLFSKQVRLYIYILTREILCESSVIRMKLRAASLIANLIRGFDLRISNEPVIGCMYRHPTSSISVQNFNKDILEPIA